MLSCPLVIAAQRESHAQIKTLPKYLIFGTFFKLTLWSIFIYERSKQEKCQISVSTIYSTGKEGQNKNKKFVYIIDFTASLTDCQNAKACTETPRRNH